MIHLTSSSLCCYVPNPISDPLLMSIITQTSTNAARCHGAHMMMAENTFYLSKNSSKMKNNMLQVKVLHSQFDLGKSR